MKYLVLLLSLPFAITVQAQTSVKAYINVTTGSFGHSFINSYLYTKQYTTLRDYVKPSAAIVFQNKKGNSHEIELSRLEVREDEKKIWTLNPSFSTYGYMKAQKTITTSLAARYEYIINIAKKKKYLVQPSVGLAGMPFYSRNNSIPYISSDYRASLTEIGVVGFVVPRINISLSKRLFIDVNIPMPVLSMASTTQYLGDPTLIPGARKYNTINFDLFPGSLSARVGFGVRF
jgi:hypothetical protein